MMQSQALALVIIRKIVEPARDFAHTPPIARNHDLLESPVQQHRRRHRLRLMHDGLPDGEYLVFGILSSHRPSRADTRPFLRLGQNSILYVKDIKY
jgi:hypothetical protein